MTSIWFKLAYMLLDHVFPDGVTLAADDALGSVVSGGGLVRISSSGKAVSSRSLCKSLRCFSDAPVRCINLHNLVFKCTHSYHYA